MDRREIIARNIERLMAEANERRAAAGLPPWSKRSLSIAAGNQNLIPDIITRGRSPTQRTIDKLAAVLECDPAEITSEPRSRELDELVQKLRNASEDERRDILNYAEWVMSRRESA